MASQVVQSFHDANMADERRRVQLRIANGTKASSPEIISYRRQHPQYKGMPDTSTGSRTTLFFQTTNQRDLPFQKMVGGVIKNFELAKGLLKQRADSSRVIDELAAGLPPQPSPLLQLSEEDSRSLELNNILSSLQDAVEIGNLTSQWVPELKNILRIFSSLLPTFTQDQLADFQTFFEEINLSLRPDKASRYMTSDNLAAERAVSEFSDKMYKLIEEYSSFIGRSLEERKARIAALLRKYFKLTPKKLGTQFVSPSAKPQYPFQPPPPASEGEIAGPQEAEVSNAAEGAEAGTDEAPSRAREVVKIRRRPLITAEGLMEMDDEGKQRYYDAGIQKIERAVNGMRKEELKSLMEDIDWALPDDEKERVAKANKEGLKAIVKEYISFFFSGEPDAPETWNESDWETFNEAITTFQSKK